MFKFIPIPLVLFGCFSAHASLSDVALVCEQAKIEQQAFGGRGFVEAVKSSLSENVKEQELYNKSKEDLGMLKWYSKMFPVQSEEEAHAQWIRSSLSLRLRELHDPGQQTGFFVMHPKYGDGVVREMHRSEDSDENLRSYDELLSEGRFFQIVGSELRRLSYKADLKKKMSKEQVLEGLASGTLVFVGNLESVENQPNLVQSLEEAQDETAIQKAISDLSNKGLYRFTKGDVVELTSAQIKEIKKVEPTLKEMKPLEGPFFSISGWHAMAHQGVVRLDGAPIVTKTLKRARKKWLEMKANGYRMDFNRSGEDAALAMQRSKDQVRVGQNNGTSRLTQEDIDRVKEAFKRGESASVILRDPTGKEVAGFPITNSEGHIEVPSVFYDDIEWALIALMNYMVVAKRDGVAYFPTVMVTALTEKIGAMFIPFSEYSTIVANRNREVQIDWEKEPTKEDFDLMFGEL